MASYLKRSYDDFEPFCQWQRGQGRDILEVHLQGFKKEHLRVQINNHGVLTISGEQPIDNNTKISRFRKEIKVYKDLSEDQIRAKLNNGILYITLRHEKPDQVKESEEDHNKTNNESTSCVRDGILRMELSKTMAVSIGVAVAVGVVVGGFLIARKCTKVPVPVIN